MGSRACLDVLEKKEMSCFTDIRTPDRPGAKNCKLLSHSVLNQLMKLSQTSFCDNIKGAASTALL
jgi:hypothetical protein